MKGLSERFKECRQGAGLTQQKAAAELGVAINTVACLEGGRLPDLTTVVKVSELFGVTLDWLVLGRGPRERPPEVGFDHAAS